MCDSRVKLTVAIPTYDRNCILRESLERLLPQLDETTTLLILDNSSPVPVARAVEETLAAFPRVTCRVIRNRVNVGANANILRCIEHCETQWAWILGDDDVVYPDALAAVLDAASANHECVYINFAADVARGCDFSTKGLTEFTLRLDGSANVPWISASLYNISRVRSNLRFGYHLTYSMLPHVALLLTSIGADGQCFFSKKQVIDRTVTPAAQDKWSMINFALGSAVLLDLPLRPDIREQLATKLLVTTDGPSVRLRAIFRELMHMCIYGRDCRAAIYYYDQICARSGYFRRSPVDRVAMKVGRLCLRYPGIFAASYRILKGRAYAADSTFPQQFGRF